MAECGSVCVCLCVAQVEKRESHLKDMNDLTQEEITGMTINAVQHAIHCLSLLSSSSHFLHLVLQLMEAVLNPEQSGFGLQRMSYCIFNNNMFLVYE